LSESLVFILQTGKKATHDQQQKFARREMFCIYLLIFGVFALAKRKKKWKIKKKK
jgi:hypothetical protein